MKTLALKSPIIMLLVFCNIVFAAQDPAAVRKTLENDLAVYSQLKSDGIEQKYNDMIVKHRSNSDQMVTTYKELAALWTRIADRLNQKPLMNGIDAEGPKFIAAVEKAKDETFNSNIRAVSESAGRLGPLFSQLYNQTKDTSEVKSQARELNSANASFTSAVSAYATYWNDKFKPVADRRQVIDIIRSKVKTAVTPEYERLKARLSDSEKKKKELQSRYEVLIAELAKLTENTPENQKRRKEIIAEIDTIDAKLNQVDGEIKTVTGLMGEFEKLLSEVDLPKP